MIRDGRFCCGICGAVVGLSPAEVVYQYNDAVFPGERVRRCGKHVDRHACAIDGCHRSTRRNGESFSDAMWLCSVHWRALVPPRSPMRRAYRRFFRLEKKIGSWPPDLNEQFWRYWRLLILRARRRAAAGTIDELEINHLFGWEEAA